VMSVELQAPAKVRLVELAELPRTKDEMKRVKVAGMMGFGALAAAVGCVSFMEWRTRRIASSYEVSHSLGLRVFGTLPAAPVRGLLGSVDPGREMRWQSVLTESVDAARTALLHASRTEPLQMVMIASAVGGEGKTSLSAHLSGSLARAGRRTLLVDCDLRRPSANRLFDLEQGPGMCEILRGEVGVAEAIRPTGVRNLSLLPAGWCDAAAIQALAHVEVQSLFDQLRREYDFVIIDTSPVLPVSDALLIAQHADAVLFSVMRNVSRTPMVQSAYHRLESLGTRMLGAVVTGEIGMTYGGRYEYEYRFGNRPGEVAASTQVGES
jgi:succinoglycan biosynthesis transport protein ExoP